MTRSKQPRSQTFMFFLRFLYKTIKALAHAGKIYKFSKIFLLRVPSNENRLIGSRVKIKTMFNG